ncbi:MAG TPA: tetratricopeptide repeat protein [Gammaproteobacteria bacterium]|nr:tetratricopeptide repeat protein [Gammaproteobacteria bacterium]
MADSDQQAALDARVVRLARLHEQDRGNLPLLCDLVDARLAAGQIDAATEEATAGLERFPGAPELQFRLASCALARRDFAEADKLLARLMERGYDAIPFRYNRALALLWLGNADESYCLLQPALPEWRQYPPIKLLLARLCHLRGELSEGLDAVSEFLATRPGSAEGHGVLALLAYDTDDWDTARAAATDALRADSAQFEARLVQTGLALAANDSAGARAAIEDVVQTRPDSGRAWSLYAQVEMLDSRLDKAERHIEQAVRHMPNHIGTWHLLAWIQLLDGRLKDTRRSLTRALELNRNFAETHGALAVVEALEGNVQAARDDIKRASRLGGASSFAAQYAESVLLERAGDREKSRAIIDAILDAPSMIPGKRFRQLIKDSLDRG